MKQILFIEQNIAQLCEMPRRAPEAGEVAVAMAYTAVSAGTERALLTGDQNVNIHRNADAAFPRASGYSGCGTVVALGSGVVDFSIGDRVLTYWGKHCQVNTLPQENIIRIDADPGNSPEAAFLFISTFALAAVRKVAPELGESCLVMGLGLLGLFSVQYARLAGAIPIIAVDPNPERRALALSLGADAVLDSLTSECAGKTLLRLTGGKGADTIIEATGNGDALNQALSHAADFARVALLGCTRKPTTIDLYHDVHGPGIRLIGAHTNARPKKESRPGAWTHRDDCQTALRYWQAGRLSIAPMISEIHSPEEAPAVYTRLAEGNHFPLGVVFDWRALP